MKINIFYWVLSNFRSFQNGILSNFRNFQNGVSSNFRSFYVFENN